jgi:hypothetical protein
VVSPNDVRANPAAHADQWLRTMRADLAFPIHIRATARGPIVLDGVHRLLKAEVEGRTTLPARWVPPELLPRIAPRPPGHAGP